ncbi:unnamed protein product [Heligmosomoides polygyrus]|uniref:legumain n=1 Tax=Heligmosomoides polygyrus TaxID=6339 RepID=A0A3P8B4F9_HELPZ|nr:unnamed protein product [Heligmosomoides polygyrus]
MQQPPSGQLYAVLVAGSDGWWNYRHQVGKFGIRHASRKRRNRTVIWASSPTEYTQADVARSYHTLIDHGVSAENIILMMKDDIAHNEENPFPGQLFNEPHGPNVYEGVKIDYKACAENGDDVTPENFLAVLKGDDKGVHGGNGRVLKTTEKDRIFVYFSDHGGTGMISFPDEVWMHSHKRYSQLVFYLEACESGSMFHKVLKNNINVYAITAANPDESSFAVYCDNDMDLPCLGDEFSVNWMQDSDERSNAEETLDEQFKRVKQETKESHVMHYGNLSIAKEPITWFEGQGSSQRKTTFVKDRQVIESVYSRIINDLVEDPQERVRMFRDRSHVENLDCHHDVVRAFDAFCIDVNKFDYALKYIYVLNNLCTKFNDSTKILKTMVGSCAGTRHHFFKS